MAPPFAEGYWSDAHPPVPCPELGARFNLVWPQDERQRFCRAVLHVVEPFLRQQDRFVVTANPAWSKLHPDREVGRGWFWDCWWPPGDEGDHSLDGTIERDGFSSAAAGGFTEGDATSRPERIKWPENYVKHYVWKNKVLPTERFYRYVVWRLGTGGIIGSGEG